MHIVTVTFDIRADFIEAFREAVLRQAGNTLEKEPNCHVFDVAEDPASAGRFFLYEKYDDAASFDLHLQSDHFREFDTLVAPWIRQKDVRTWSELGSAT